MIQGNTIDSPLLELEDFIIGLENKFNRERLLRRRLRPISALALTLISHADFEKKFGSLSKGHDGEGTKIIWSDGDLEEVLVNIEKDLNEREWRLAKSVFQGVSPLNNKIVGDVPDQSGSLGGAFSILEMEIALLDKDQHKVAIQIAPGPQRIRGLAGTGKTVVLAMKAANIHLRYPKKRILFTFNTQSLYNQARTLISKFYRMHSDADPDWEKLHLRHGWGGRHRPGFYYDLCNRLGITPFTFVEAKRLNARSPFRICCRDILKHKIEPFYDFILVDEAQDFPGEFFQILAKSISTEKRRIYIAYDELQNLSAVELPRAEELFGVDDEGHPFISFEGEDYPGDIERDFVLHRSYRCPIDVLMLAHGIGLGIHNPRGCVQMLTNRTSWESLGYRVQQGELNVGDDTIIYRPPENSPNRIKNIYTGTQELVTIHSFDKRDDEFSWIADSISNEIKKEDVSPEQIVVISLDNLNAKKYLMEIQNILLQKGISSTIPGLVDRSWEFAEIGRVTLSTVYRAKGNEAPLVYIMGFEALYSYAEEIESRNRAFTSISRTKGCIRISGTGKQMKDAEKEINLVLADIPRFKFKFPNMQDIRIRKLDASETTRRRKEVKLAKQSLSKLLEIDKEALSDLDDELLSQLTKKLKEVSDEN